MSNITLDPRQALSINYYKNPKSETFGNLTQSMVKAGFEHSYARQVTSKKREWLTESIKGDVSLIKRAEKNLAKYANIEIDLKDRDNIDIARLQVDVSKFILKTLGKKKYSEDEEAEAPSVQINIVNYNNAPSAKTGTDDMSQSHVTEGEVVEPSA